MLALTSTLWPSKSSGRAALLEFADEVLQLDIGAFNTNLREQLQADR